MLTNTLWSIGALRGGSSSHFHGWKRESSFLTLTFKEDEPAIVSFVCSVDVSRQPSPEVIDGHGVVIQNPVPAHPPEPAALVEQDCMTAEHWWKQSQFFFFICSWDEHYKWLLWNLSIHVLLKNTFLVSLLTGQYVCNHHINIWSVLFN